MAQSNKLANAYAVGMRAKWADDLKHGFFDIEPYLSTSLQHLPEFADFFTTNLKLDPVDHIPGIPSHYTREYNEERAMYLFNVPRTMTPTRCREILVGFGTVEKLPMVTDLISRETFRWVIMSTKEEATRLYQMLRLMPIAECNKGNMVALTPCRPGRGLVVGFYRHISNKPLQTIADGTPIHGEKIELPQNLLDDKKAASSSGRVGVTVFTLDPAAAVFDAKGLQSSSSRASPQLTESNKALNASTVQSLEPKTGFTPQQQEDAKPYDSITQIEEPLAMLLRSLMRTITPKNPMDGTRSDSGASEITPTSSLQIAFPKFGPASNLIEKRSFTTLPHGGSVIEELDDEQSDITTETFNSSTLIRVSKYRVPRKDSHSSKLSTSVVSASPINSNHSTSWAAIANAGTSEKVIDIATSATANPPNRLRPVARLPSNTSSRSIIEPLSDQMRVVFILDIPHTLTYDDISKAVREGPLRSIHFGTDEEKGSRFAAIVFQHATDAVTFVKVLQKERADCRPERFRWIVDVARGEEPFPLDDVLKAMQAPTFATRRLTLVKASLFFMMGERQLRVKIEKVVGEGLIQLIWLYNGGNATVVFSDVTAAIRVKKELDRYSASAGKKDGAPMAWAGLLTTFSKDPCVQPLDLKTAMHE